MGRDRLKIGAMLACSAACAGVCILLYHEREEQSKILQNMVSDFAKEGVMQNPEEQEDAPQSLVNSDSVVLVGDQETYLRELEDELQLLQIKCDLQRLLKEKEADSTNPQMVYEKYFQVKQGDMARIEGIENLDTCGQIGVLNSHFSGVVFEIDENVLLQYRNNALGQIWEYLTPRTIIITDAVPYMGFMGTLAGMDFAQIQEHLYETQVQEGFMYFDDGTVYYLQYEDEYYEYIFYSDYEDGSDAWLLISHASGGKILADDIL